MKLINHQFLQRDHYHFLEFVANYLGLCSTRRRLRSCWYSWTTRGGLKPALLQRFLFADSLELRFRLGGRWWNNHQLRLGFQLRLFDEIFELSFLHHKVGFDAVAVVRRHFLELYFDLRWLRFLLALRLQLFACAIALHALQLQLRGIDFLRRMFLVVSAPRRIPAHFRCCLLGSRSSRLGSSSAPVSSIDINSSALNFCLFKSFSLRLPAGSLGRVEDFPALDNRVLLEEFRLRDSMEARIGERLDHHVRALDRWTWKHSSTAGRYLNGEHHTNVFQIIFCSLHIG